MAHGSHWNALTEDIDGVINSLSGYIQNGIPVMEIGESLANQRFMYFRGKEEPLSIVFLLESKPENHEVLSFYPVAWSGELNTLEVRNVDELDNDGDECVEGVVNATINVEREITFFAPFFQREKHRLLSGNRFEFELSAIAYMVQKGQSEITVTEGPMLDIERNRRKEEPGFDPASVTSVTLYMSQLRCFFPRGSGDIEFQAPVDAVESFDAPWCKGKVLTVNLMPEEEVPLRIKIYVSDKTLAGYVPVVGEPVAGTAWLQGRIHASGGRVIDESTQ